MEKKLWNKVKLINKMMIKKKINNQLFKKMRKKIMVLKYLILIKNLLINMN